MFSPTSWQWLSGVDLFSSSLVSRQHREAQKMKEKTSAPLHTRTHPSMCCLALVSITKSFLPIENETQEKIVVLIFATTVLAGPHFKSPKFEEYVF